MFLHFGPIHVLVKYAKPNARQRRLKAVIKLIGLVGRYGGNRQNNFLWFCKLLHQVGFTS